MHGIEWLFTDGPVVVAMTTAGNVALIASMTVFAFVWTWTIVRLPLSGNNRRALIGDAIHLSSWSVYRWFWFLAILFAVPHVIECNVCMRAMKESSYALWAWDLRGVVTMAVSAGVAYGAVMRASSFLPLQYPYTKATIMLLISWGTGLMAPDAGYLPALVAILGMVGIAGYRLERLYI